MYTNLIFFFRFFFKKVLYFRMGGGEGFKTPHGHMYHGGVWLAANQFPPANTQEAIVIYIFLKHYSQYT